MCATIPKRGLLSVIPDLDRIKALGTDIIWLMPIHPIGEKKQKGGVSAVPMPTRDYRTVNPCYGTMGGFQSVGFCNPRKRHEVHH